jgi:hypothetical protein
VQYPSQSYNAIYYDTSLTLTGRLLWQLVFDIQIYGVRNN